MVPTILANLTPAADIKPVELTIARQAATNPEQATHGLDRTGSNMRHETTLNVERTTKQMAETL